MTNDIDKDKSFVNEWIFLDKHPKEWAAYLEGFKPKKSFSEIKEEMKKDYIKELIHTLKLLLKELEFLDDL